MTYQLEMTIGKNYILSPAGRGKAACCAECAASGEPHSDDESDDAMLEAIRAIGESQLTEYVKASVGKMIQAKSYG